VTTLAEASDFFALRRAARRAARGHSRSPEVAAFLVELEVECLRLHRELREGSWQPGGFRHFRIRDPKPRTISVAPFRDRVVHHAVCAALEPVFEAHATDDSYACRIGKGNRAMVWRVQALSRRYPWFAKLDVRHYFETVPVARLTRLLRCDVRDRPLLVVLERILDAGSQDGLGLPIGNLTSQHFANHYLGSVDRFVRDDLGLPWCRYMDDMFVFASGRADAHVAAQSVAAHLAALGLREKREARRVAPVAVGVPVLGFRVWPQRVRLDGARKRRALASLRAVERGAVGPRAGQARAQAVVAWCAHGDTRGLIGGRVVREVD
jgi:RNA-directed DNA polymerase